jgi:hypothetical protein
MHDDSKCFIKFGSELQVMIIGMLEAQKSRNGGNVHREGKNYQSNTMLENKSTINYCKKVLGKSSEGDFFLPSKGSSFFAPT